MTPSSSTGISLTDHDAAAFAAPSSATSAVADGRLVAALDSPSTVCTSVLVRWHVGREETKPRWLNSSARDMSASLESTSIDTPLAPLGAMVATSTTRNSFSAAGDARSICVVVAAATTSHWQHEEAERADRMFESCNWSRECSRQCEEWHWKAFRHEGAAALPGRIRHAALSR